MPSVVAHTCHTNYLGGRGKENGPNGPKQKREDLFEKQIKSKRTGSGLK
jgi:hypothetical protein